MSGTSSRLFLSPSIFMPVVRLRFRAVRRTRDAHDGPLRGHVRRVGEERTRVVLAGSFGAAKVAHAVYKRAIMRAIAAAP